MTVFVSDMDDHKECSRLTSCLLSVHLTANVGWARRVRSAHQAGDWRDAFLLLSDSASSIVKYIITGPFWMNFSHIHIVPRIWSREKLDC